MDIKLEITMNVETGNVNVSGPVENKGLCYGMLEMARDAIKDFKPSPIVKPNGVDINRIVN